MRLTFSGDRALLTGGTCELALCLAEKMISSGIFPILTCRRAEGEEYIHNKLKDFDGRYKTIPLDFSKAEDLDSLTDRISGKLDFLVDFAQGDFESLVSGADDKAVYEYFSHNISFRAGLVKRVSRIMLRQRRGRMVFISSSAAKLPNPGQGFYAAAKSASEAIYKNIGLELGSKGITTITLRPGYIDAGRGKKYIADRKKEISSRIPAGKPCTPEQIAETILFLLSDSAASFNAAEITMDGGLTAGK